MVLHHRAGHNGALSGNTSTTYRFCGFLLFAQAELGYILILGTVLPMYLLYRGTEKLTSVHTALYRYIQPVIAGILAITRGQAHF